MVQDPTLLAFLRVLLLHHVSLEKIASDQTERNWARHQAQVKALGDVVEQLGRGETVNLPDFFLEMAKNERAILIPKIRFEALPFFLRRLAVDESLELPPILQGRFDKARLCDAVRACLERVTAHNKSRPPEQHEQPPWGELANEVWAQQTEAEGREEMPLMCAVQEAVRHELQNVEDAKRANSDSPVEPNWLERAGRLLNWAEPFQVLSKDVGDTPWRRAIAGLKRKWEGPSFETDSFFSEGHFAEYVRVWVFRDGICDEPDDKTKELARLNRMGVQHELLADIRSGFPQKAEEWFRTTDASRAETSGDPASETKAVGGGSLTEQERKERLRSLPQSARHAYFAFEYAEQKSEKALEDLEAYSFLKQRGLPEDAGELTDYKLPTFANWARYLRTAREALHEQKYKRRERVSIGRSVVSQQQIERPRHDEDP
jgi:hypothetical protein